MGPDGVCAMAKKKKQSSNATSWIILGLVALGTYQFVLSGSPDRSGSATARPTAPVASRHRDEVLEPLNTPRYVNVASLNVRHTPSTSGPLIMALPRGTQLRAMGREGAWLLVDLSPTLEGWVWEGFTTTEDPKQRYVPPAFLKGSR